MPAAFPYSKLPGRRRGLFVSGSLWLGADHFLSVRNLRFTEDYRRFYFRDVQAIVIRKTPRFYFPVPWLWALFASFVPLVIALVANQSVLGALLFLPPAGIVLWLAFAAIFQGCRCHVQTAVSREEIPALVRLRHARRAVEILSAKVAEAQGALPDNWALEDSETSLAPVPAAPLSDSSPAAAHIGMWLALATFLLLLGDAVFTYFYAHNLLNQAWQTTGAVLIVVEAAVMVFSLVFLRGPKVLRTVRNLVIAGIVFAGGTYYIGYNASIVIQALQQNHTIRTGNPRSFPVMSWIDAVNEVGNTALGAAGLAAWVSGRRKMTWPA
jgi:hypothetical protein